MKNRNAGPFDGLKCIKENMKWLTPLRDEYGFKTFVDATNNECVRDPLFLAKMATIMELNIICSTGYYYEPASAFKKFRSGFADVVSEMNSVTVELGRLKIFVTNPAKVLG